MLISHERRVVRAFGPAGLCAGQRRGVTAADVIVLVVLIILAVLLILMFLPRGREHARMAGCENNLAHIGFANEQYDFLEKRLPAVEGVAAPESAAECA